MKRIFLLLVVTLVLGGCAAEPAQPALAPSGKTIWVELDRMRLILYENGTEIARFPIAAGARNSPTPVGIFHINRRYVTELSGFGTRFMGLNVNFGDFGIHGTNKPASIGGHFSHGCIRMRIPDAEKLYSLTGYGTKVIIDGGPYGAFTNGLRTLSPGDRGSDVKEMQLRLIRHGFLHGWPDGVFGENTKKAVIAARQHFGLPTGDTADYTLLTKLGIMQFE
ncbi:MAG: L,D-transpeptidase family protein [Clostridia bacterium]|nr:L,D-transpeptidase family protein [Clostridia bacterium]